MSADRLTDERVQGIANLASADTVAATLAREVQAHRKLVADLLALKPKGNPGSLQRAGYERALRAVRRLIEADRG